MASTYSNLKIQLMGTGENSGTWGTITNTNLGTALEEAIVGSADVSFSSADVTLTLTDTNSSQIARNLRLNLTGSVAAAQNLIVPAIEKIYLINNTLAYDITVKNSTGTGIAVPAGKTMWVYNNGTHVVDAVTHLTSLTLGTPLAIASGGTGTNLATFCNLQSNVTGVLPVANGGTGVTGSTGTGSVVLSASPTLTGTPAAPTASNGTNTTQIATTAFVSNAITQQGLGTMATQNANAVNITGGSITNITDLAIADGGTGASTASGARTNLGLGTLATLNSITSAQLPAGTVVQTQYAQYTGSNSGGSGWSDTGITVNITPVATSNKVLVRVCFSWSATDGTATLWRLVRNGTVVGAGASGASLTIGTDSFVRPGIFSASFEFLDSPSSTSALTYKLQGSAPNGGNVWVINQNQFSGSLSGYTSTSSITAQEIAG